MIVISLSNQKGGCGKTTSSINLAASLAYNNYKVLLIDLDPQAHASMGVGIKTDRIEKSMYNVLTSSQDKQKDLNDVILHLWENFDLASGHILLSTVEQELSNQENAISLVYNAINRLNIPYDFVIIDCPPSLGFLTFNALRASHEVIIPVETSSYSLSGVGKLINMIELIQLKLHRSPKIKGLVTIFDKRTNFSNRMLDEIKEYFGDNLFSTIIRINVTLREASSKGISCIKYDKYSNGSKDYLTLAEEVILDSKKLQLENFYERAESLLQNIKETIKIKNFNIYSPNSKEIYIVGDFNNWTINDNSRLDYNKGGFWEKRLTVKPGRYRYKFVIDGKWIHDPNNSETEANQYGGLDSILKI